MHRIVIDHARRSKAVRHDGDPARFSLNESLVENASPGNDAELLSLDKALDRLDVVNRDQREVVELHYFAELTFPEITALYECNVRTALRQWDRTRRWRESIGTEVVSVRSLPSFAVRATEFPSTQSMRATHAPWRSSRFCNVTADVVLLVDAPHRKPKAAPSEFIYSMARHALGIGAHFAAWITARR